MLDSGGNLRIRSTGIVAIGGGERTVQKSVIASYRSRSFTDYAYFTDYETISPNLYYSWLHVPFYGNAAPPDVYPIVGANLVALNYPYAYMQDIRLWAQQNCLMRKADGRGWDGGWWDYIYYYSYYYYYTYTYLDVPINCEPRPAAPAARAWRQ